MLNIFPPKVSSVEQIRQLRIIWCTTKFRWETQIGKHMFAFDVDVLELLPKLIFLCRDCLLLDGLRQRIHRIGIGNIVPTFLQLNF